MLKIRSNVVFNGRLSGDHISNFYRNGLNYCSFFHRHNHSYLP